MFFALNKKAKVVIAIALTYFLTAIMVYVNVLCFQYEYYFFTSALGYFLIILSVSTFMFFISQIWRLPLKAKIPIFSIFFPIVFSLIFMYGMFPQKYINDNFIELFFRPLLHPIGIMFSLSALGIFCGEHLLFRKIQEMRL
jgi:hypothetical protein